MREIIYDSETTGLDAAAHRMVSVAGVELINKTPTGRFVHFYLNPDRESDPRALEVHGLTTEFLSTKPRFVTIAASLLDFIAGAPLVIHNASFDTAFLNSELIRAARDRYTGRVHCTLCVARKRWPYPQRNRLDDLVFRLGTPDPRAITGKHGALVDCLTLVNVYRRLEGLPVLDFDLSPYMDLGDGRQGERSTESETVPGTAAASPVSGGAGSRGEGTQQELRRGGDVPDSDEAGRPESAGAAARAVGGGSQVGEVA